MSFIIILLLNICIMHVHLFSILLTSYAAFTININMNNALMFSGSDIH